MEKSYLLSVYLSGYSCAIVASCGSRAVSKASVVIAAVRSENVIVEAHVNGGRRQRLPGIIAGR
jgi:hypothetical protein